MLRQFFVELTEEEKFYGWFQPTLHIYLCRLCLTSSRTELSAVVFGAPDLSPRLV
jgi:hypothetical protein